MLLFLVFPGRLWWPQTCDIQNLSRFSNLPFFFPSLLAEWHSCVLADSPLPWIFPSMKLLSASDEWVLCLNSARAKGTATIRTATFRVWWIWAFTEIFITSPSLPLELNLSQAVFNLIYFLKEKKRWQIERDSVTVILSWCKTQRWAMTGCSARQSIGASLDKQGRQWCSCLRYSRRATSTAKAVLKTSWVYSCCKHLLFIGTWYTKSGMIF